jgi:hypothetical protein
MREQRLTLTQALHALTTGGAYGIFAEDELGAIVPGMLADLVVLSEDPFDVPLKELERIGVVMVFVGGTLEVCARPAACRGAGRGSARPVRDLRPCRANAPPTMEEADSGRTDEGARSTNPCTGTRPRSARHRSVTRPSAWTSSGPIRIEPTAAGSTCS